MCGLVCRFVTVVLCDQDQVDVARLAHDPVNDRAVQDLVEALLINYPTTMNVILR